MSVASFLAAAAPYAGQEASVTGLDCRLFLVQWGLETGWGSSNLARCNNWAGLTCDHCTAAGTCSGRFACLPSPAAFRSAYDCFLHNGNYGGVLAARGQSLSAQFVALGVSPWDAGHYAGTCGHPGCALQNLYAANQSAVDGAARNCAAGTPPPPGGGPGGGFTGLALISAAIGVTWLYRHRDVVRARAAVATSRGVPDGYAERTSGEKSTAPRRASTRVGGYTRTRAEAHNDEYEHGGKVYVVEGVLSRAGLDGGPITEAEANALADQIALRHPWRRQPNRPRVEFLSARSAPVMGLGPGTRAMTSAQDIVYVNAASGPTRLDILHEAAHATAPDGSPIEPNHGPRWRERAARLYGEYLSVQAEREFRSLMDMAPGA